MNTVPFLDLAPMHEEVRPELDAVWQNTADTGRFVGGPVVASFEEAFAQACGADHCVGVGNGTDALQLILLGLGIGPGDEVIIPTNTFVATAEAVVSVGATPVFVDVDPTTLLITGDIISAAVTARTVAVMAVHLYGQPVNADDVGAVCATHGLAFIEDAAQAHLATWQNRPAGSLGIAAGFSFYPGKNLGAFGDGGAVVTSRGDLANRIRSIADHGRVPGSRYEHDQSGMNSRLDAVQAGVLEVKLRRLEDWNASRRHAWERYVAELPDAVRPVAVASDARSAHHLAVVEVPDRDAFQATLDANGIGYGQHYPVPCHLQVAFKSWANGPLPIAEAAGARIVSLPMFPHLTTAHVDRTLEVIHGHYHRG